MSETDRMLQLSTSQISDGLREAGLPGIGLVGIGGCDPTKRFAGRALTVRFAAVDDPGVTRVEYLSFVSPGDVIVIDNAGRMDCSSWGGQRSIGAKQRGAVGTVLYGAYRDVEENLAFGYPVFGLGSTVAGGRTGGVMPVAVGEVLSIKGCEVRPGDYVMGDASGVIVVPSTHIDVVLERAEKLKAQESAVTEAVEEGADFIEYRATVRGEG